MSRAATIVVWVVWGALLAAGLALVAHYGSNVPSWDEWDMVPTLTGAQPVSAEWLWSQHNEHRVPLPRLVLLAVNCFGPDFRIAQVLNVLALAAVSAGLILAVRRARGRTLLADALFPLLRLHWGHAPNLLWGWEFQFVVSAALACVLLLAVVSVPARPGRSAWIAGTCLLLLPLCGANGVALVPAMALWLGYDAVRALRAKETARGLAVLAMAVTSLVLTGLYFVGFEKVPNYAMSASWRATFVEAIRTLTAGFGSSLGALWPASGFVAFLVLLATAAMLAWTSVRRPDERNRALGLLAFLGAMSSLALGMGYGGRWGFEPRYVTFAAPVWCATFLAWALCAPGALRAACPSALALAALLALVPNTRAGLEYARDLRWHLWAFERDMRAGMPPHLLIARHRRYLHPHHELLTDYMPMLRAARVGAFAELRDDPELVEVPLALDALSTDQCTIEGDTIRAPGSIPTVVLALPTDGRRLVGFRLECVHTSPQPGLPCIALYWHAGAADARFGERYYMFSPTGDRLTWERNSWSRRSDDHVTLTCWLDEPATYLRLHPDYKPCELRVLELVMLLEPGP